MCHHWEGGYASYRKVQGGLATPSRVLIKPECETRLRIVRRGQKYHGGSRKAAAHRRRPATQQESKQRPGCTVHFQHRIRCSAQTPPAEVLVSLVVGVFFFFFFSSFPPPVYKSEKVTKVNCRRSETDDPDLTGKQRSSNT